VTGPSKLDDHRVTRVTGIGGFCFRARDPDALNRWYVEHLGVVMLDSRTYDDRGWFQARGECVFSAVDADSKLRGPLEKRWMLNLRDDDLDGMVETLRAAGIAVEPHPEPYPNGRFADLADPEGDRIQLWEPNAASLARDPGRQR
jgi:glyoxylase I family protein